MKRLLTTLLLGSAFATTLGGCIFDHQSDVVSKNLSTAADQFQVLRRVVFYNGITGDYMLTIEGFCALGNNDPKGEVTVVCKTGQDKYNKSFLGLSDNVTYFVQQLDDANVSADHYKVIFKPSVILPDVSAQ